MKLGSKKCYESWPPKTVCDNINWEIKSHYACEIRLQRFSRNRQIHAFEAFYHFFKLDMLHGRVCNVLRGQIFTLDLSLSNRSRTCTWNDRKMSRIYNTVSAPEEFLPFASIEKGLSKTLWFVRDTCQRMSVNIMSRARSTAFMILGHWSVCMIGATLNDLLYQYLATTNHNVENVYKKVISLQIMQSSSLHTRCKRVNTRVE